MTAEIIHEFFAWAPLTVFVFLLVVLYVVTRGKTHATVAAGKTYACARCGRRGKHEHMVPMTHEGAVVWYCGRCSSAH